MSPICITPPSTAYGPTGLPPLDDESDDTSTTQDCDTIDDTVDTDNIDDSLETHGQVSFNYKEVINELEELWEYKESVRHRRKAMLRELREVSIRGDIEGRLLPPHLETIIRKACTGQYHHGRHHQGMVMATSYSYPPETINMEYNGSWTTFVLRNELLITQARSDEIAHRHNVHQLMTGRAGNPKTKLNQRIRQLAFQHNIVKHLTKIIKSPWYGYTQDNAIISERTLVLHPTLVEFMRIHGFGSRIIAEGIMFGDSDRFADMKIDMFGQMSNMNYVGPSLTCPKDVLDEFEIGKN